MLKECILQLSQQQNLSMQQCKNALDELLNNKVNQLQAGAMLALLHAKGETIEELLAFIQYLKAKMIPVPVKSPVLDIVGTGGDGAKTVNISTGSAILAASGGVNIAKHGNRSVSSLSGSADVIEALGITLISDPEIIAESIETIGIGFIYAPYFHPALNQIKLLRKALNTPTIFNLLGPLLNPANPQYLLLGVAKPTLHHRLAEIVLASTIKHAITVHGNGLDEMHTASPIDLIEVKNNHMTMQNLNPQSLGFAASTVKDLQGGNATENAELLLNALNGKKGAIADALILNAATAFYLYGLTATINDGIQKATEHLYNGDALALLNRWIEFSHDKHTR